jgi:hypothetical protein
MINTLKLRFAKNHLYGPGANIILNILRDMNFKSEIRLFWVGGGIIQFA